MLFWVAFAAMTGLAAAAVLVPLARHPAPAGVPDLAIYRDQLAEIDRDAAAGQIGAAEADAARIEVKRRLLAAADQAEAAPQPAGADRRRRVVAVAGLVGVPALAILLYATLGSPELPDQPLATRLAAPADHQDLAALVLRVEMRLADNPEDGRAWELLAPIYLHAGRYGDAVVARRNALRLLGGPERESNLGEALFAEAGGKLTAAARTAFARAAAADPQQPKARFFLGLADEEDGKPEAAAVRWRALLTDAPAEAPWRELVVAALARVGAAPGPSADDVVRAQEMTPDERQAMIRGMVASLAERLKTDGGDVEGWMRLVRAHQVLGDAADARAALAAARAALREEPDKLRRLDEFVKELGLDG